MDLFDDGEDLRLGNPGQLVEIGQCDPPRRLRVHRSGEVVGDDLGKLAKRIKRMRHQHRLHVEQRASHAIAPGVACQA